MYFDLYVFLLVNNQAWRSAVEQSTETEQSYQHLAAVHYPIVFFP